MRIGKQWWRATVASGSAASLLSAFVAYRLSRRENRAPFAAINAVSHWWHGPAAYGVDRPVAAPYADRVRHPPRCLRCSGARSTSCCCTAWSTAIRSRARLGRSARRFRRRRSLGDRRRRHGDRCLHRSPPRPAAPFARLRAPALEGRRGLRVRRLRVRPRARGTAARRVGGRRRADRARWMPRQRLHYARLASTSTRGPHPKGSHMLSPRPLLGLRRDAGHRVDTTRTSAQR